VRPAGLGGKRLHCCDVVFNVPVSFALPVLLGDAEGAAGREPLITDELFAMRSRESAGSRLQQSWRFKFSLGRRVCSILISSGKKGWSERNQMEFAGESSEACSGRGSCSRQFTELQLPPLRPSVFPHRHVSLHHSIYTSCHTHTHTHTHTLSSPKAKYLCVINTSTWPSSFKQNLS
jgi:hypothetical protein